jgi:hypothetical protein
VEETPTRPRFEERNPIRISKLFLYPPISFPRLPRDVFAYSLPPDCFIFTPNAGVFSKVFALIHFDGAVGDSAEPMAILDLIFWYPTLKNPNSEVIYRGSSWGVNNNDPGPGPLAWLWDGYLFTGPSSQTPATWNSTAVVTLDESFGPLPPISTSGYNVLLAGASIILRTFTASATAQIVESDTLLITGSWEPIGTLLMGPHYGMGSTPPPGSNA